MSLFTKNIFVVFLGVVLPALSACSTTSQSKSNPLTTICHKKSGTCWPAAALSASKETLLTNGAVLTISCEQLVEKKLDDAYHQKCRHQIEEVAAALSEKWKDTLVPIAPDQINYRETWGCVDTVDRGFCYSEGLADLPMQWKN